MGLLVAAVVLVVMLGTFIGAGLPILTALIGVGIGALGSLSLSGVVDMASVTPVLGLMLGLAVGIDYSLFIVNRHRRSSSRVMTCASPSRWPTGRRATRWCSPGRPSSSPCSRST
ncbi:MMPL family transporter [Oerskovia sp. M15]